MKFLYFLRSAGLLLLLFLTPNLTFSAVHVSEKGAEKSEISTSKKLKKTARKQAKINKFTEKLVKKIEKKLERKKEKGQRSALIDDERMRLGLILVVAGALGSIILVSWLAWAAGLAFIAGLVLILLALLDY
jgi:Flp pilus assembly protein TadB